jgi:hypothetical protein
MLLYVVTSKIPPTFSRSSKVGYYSERQVQNMDIPGACQSAEYNERGRKPVSI